MTRRPSVPAAQAEPEELDVVPPPAAKAPVAAIEAKPRVVEPAKPAAPKVSPPVKNERPPAPEAKKPPKAPVTAPLPTAVARGTPALVVGTSEAAREGKRTSDLTIAALGITLGLICALFPWYIFFNQEKFGIRAVTFEGGDLSASAVQSGDLPERVGAPMTVEDFPIDNLDLFSTGTLPDRGGDEADNQETPPGVDEQPFPEAAGQVEFRLVHVANGRAMIADDSGYWVVQPGSVLPDSTLVASIEKREGHWVLVTSADRVIEMTP